MRILLQDPQILSLVLGGALALDNGTNALVNIASLVVGDANADAEARDKTPAYYTSTLSVNDAKRNESQEFIVSIHDAVNENGSEKYPLDVRMNCFVTKLEINDSANPPRAIGVGLLDGKYLYKASPLSSNGKAGVHCVVRGHHRSRGI